MSKIIGLINFVQDLTPTKSLDKNLDITTSSIQSNQFNAGIDDQSASTPRRDERTFKVPKTETVLKETTGKRNLPVEPEQDKVNTYFHPNSVLLKL